ncbi:MAG: hypothetical protein Homavirus12_14 [Homavirus sp.]|uniref:Uncharacterized protein n=1 Tax=Homavirus sp. TaxID=2487769 RepID=A0A3G5A4K6_9VIRU|nr:MAG: hypothetical protein Homavirus12_14 [Homavirus sp.]
MQTHVLYTGKNTLQYDGNFALYYVFDNQVAFERYNAKSENDRLIERYLMDIVNPSVPKMLSSFFGLNSEKKQFEFLTEICPCICKAMEEIMANISELESDIGSKTNLHSRHGDLDNLCVNMSGKVDIKDNNSFIGLSNNNTVLGLSYNKPVPSLGQDKKNYRYKLLYGYNYTFKFTEIDQNDIAQIMARLKDIEDQINRKVTNDPIKIAVFKAGCVKSYHMYELALNFHNKYKHLLEKYNHTSMLNMYDLEHQNFLGELYQLYKIIFDQATTMCDFRNRLSYLQLKKFKKIVKHDKNLNIVNVNLKFNKKPVVTNN